MTQIQVRKNVFETNSSSSHSLIIEKGSIPVYLSKEHAIHGKIVVELDQFGWGPDYLFNMDEKLSYIFTDQISHLFGGRGENDNVRDDVEYALRENELLSRVAHVLKEYTGCELEVECNISYPGVDHQSRGLSNDLLSLNDEELLFYLISTSCGVELDHDNH